MLLKIKKRRKPLSPILFVVRINTLKLPYLQEALES